MRLEWFLVAALLGACASGGEKPVRAAAATSRLSSDGRTNLGLAQSYLATNQIKKATERANMALASDPGSANVHTLFGVIHSRNGDADKAEKSFERALRLAPNDGTVLNAHASWLCGKKQYMRADTEFNRALLDRSYRTPMEAVANAGKCAYQAGYWAKAEGYFRRVLEASPNDAPVLFLLADSELRQNKLMEAQAFIQRRDGLGSDAKTLELAARIEDAANNHLAAARYRQRLREEFPDYVPTGEGAQTP